MQGVQGPNERKDRGSRLSGNAAELPRNDKRFSIISNEGKRKGSTRVPKSERTKGRKGNPKVTQEGRCRKSADNPTRDARIRLGALGEERDHREGTPKGRLARPFQRNNKDRRLGHPERKPVKVIQNDNRKEKGSPVRYPERRARKSASKTKREEYTSSRNTAEPAIGEVRVQRPGQGRRQRRGCGDCGAGTEKGSGR